MPRVEDPGLALVRVFEGGRGRVAGVGGAAAATVAQIPEFLGREEGLEGGDARAHDASVDFGHGPDVDLETRIGLAWQAMFGGDEHSGKKNSPTVRRGRDLWPRYRCRCCAGAPRR